MKVERIAYGSPSYEATVELRRAVLRRPLGLDFTPEQLEAEKDDVHLALFEGGEALACLIFSPLPSGRVRREEEREEEAAESFGVHPQVEEGPGVRGGSLGARPQVEEGPEVRSTLKMRQVAVRPDLQGTGLGRRLVEASEIWVQEHGYARIVLHARETAVPFYLRLGYAVEGEPFEEVGLPHRAMAKGL